LRGASCSLHQFLAYEIQGALALPLPRDVDGEDTPSTTVQFGHELTNKTILRHTLSDEEKRDYLDAELCVLTSPAKTKLPGALTMYDDLVATHQLQTTLVHSTGTFLPYHRFYIHLHEVTLRDCGFKGDAVP
jgi:hypothetical protein